MKRKSQSHTMDENNLHVVNELLHIEKINKYNKRQETLVTRTIIGQLHLLLLHQNCLKFVFLEIWKHTCRHMIINLDLSLNTLLTCVFFLLKV